MRALALALATGAVLGVSVVREWPVARQTPDGSHGALAGPTASVLTTSTDTNNNCTHSIRRARAVTPALAHCTVARCLPLWCMRLSVLLCCCYTRRLVQAAGIGGVLPLLCPCLPLAYAYSPCPYRGALAWATVWASACLHGVSAYASQGYGVHVQ